MKIDTLPLTSTVNLAAPESDSQRIVTLDFAGPAARSEPPLAASRDVVLPQAMGPAQDAGQPAGEYGNRRRGGALPVVSEPLHRLFTWYSRRYLRRHFHSLRVSRASALPVTSEYPLVVYSNHASWWDPLVALLLAREFLPGRRVFAPIEATALERYGFFKRLGAFGVESGTQRGAAQFLRMARAILRSSENTLWLTPQSRFADVRERPASFKAGIGHLPGQMGHLCFVPVAIEYVFWEERLPEILVRFGEPFETDADEMQLEPPVWTEFFAGRLADTQNALAAEARHRQVEKFRCLLHGNAGVGGIYDRWRALKARWQGKSFQPQHGEL